MWVFFFLYEVFKQVGEGIIDNYYLPLLPYIKSLVNHTFPKLNKTKTQLSHDCNSDHETSVSQQNFLWCHWFRGSCTLLSFCLVKVERDWEFLGLIQILFQKHLLSNRSTYVTYSFPFCAFFTSNIKTIIFKIMLSVQTVSSLLSHYMTLA